MEKRPQLQQTFEIHVWARPEQFWEALTNPEQTRQYFSGCEVRSDWRSGSRVVYETGNSPRASTEGTVLEVTSPNRLVMTWSFVFDPDDRRG